MVCFTVYFRYKDYVKGGLQLKTYEIRMEVCILHERKSYWV